MLRKKSIALGLVLLLVLVQLLLWAQPWFIFSVTLPSTADPTVAIDGSIAASPFSGLCLAMLALCAVLSLSRGFIALLLGVVGLVLSVLSAMSVITAVVNPLASSLPSFTKFTGLTSLTQIQAYVTTVSTTPAAFLLIVASLACIAAWIVVCLSARSWTGDRSRKYEAAAAPNSKGANRAHNGDSITDWDDLSTGIDPTTR